MMRRVRASLVLLLLAGAALLLGLTGTTLRTGWIDPLDWLLPGGVVMIAMLLLASRSGAPLRSRHIVWLWSLVAAPALIFCLLAGVGRPWLAMGLLAVGLALVAGGAARALRLAPAKRWLALAALIGAAAVVPFLMMAWSGTDAPTADKPSIGVMAGVPVQGVPFGAAQGIAPAEAIGLGSPLWHQLEARFRPRPLDTLDVVSLSGLDALLLVQPRLLAPAELVALDRWTRGGGRAVILADPLLHWADPRPHGHPGRAPLTSLLDPLLSHWGLRLEPAEVAGGGDPIERRRLDGGRMVQLSGASRFAAQGEGSCVLQDGGLIARCRIEQGAVLLIADADWANDLLWTLDPDNPADRRAWTSDAVDLLDGWLRGAPARLTGRGTWLVDRDTLLHALRLSLALLLALVAAERLVAGRPMPSQVNFDTNMDHNRNKYKTNLDTT